MSDIFVSYANEDRDRIIPLVHALEKAGWSVFWDRTIPTGRTWRQMIGTEIDACRCMLVVWSKRSIDSDWVQEEADEGKRRGVLAPVLIDDVLPPIGFRGIQAAKLVDWDGKAPSAEFDRLLNDLSNILGAAPTKVEEEQQRQAEEEAAKAREQAAKEAEVQRRQEAEGVRRAEQAAQRKAEAAQQQRAEQEARRKAEAERKAAEKAKAEVKQLVPPTSPVVKLREKIKLSVLLITIGWAIGGAIAGIISRATVPNIYPTIRLTIGGVIGEAIGLAISLAISWAMGGAISGLFTGLALRRTGLFAQWMHIVPIVIGWAMGMGGMGFAATMGWVIRGNISWAMGCAMGGAISGLFTGLALRRTGLFAQWMHIVPIVIGWATCWAMGCAMGGATGGAIGLAISWTICGNIGSGLIWWQLSRAQGNLK